MMWKTIKIATPEGFDFGLTVRSHGWYDLAPFRFDETKGTLSYVFLESGGKTARANVRPDGRNLNVSLERPVSERSTIPAKVRHIFRLDDNLDEFYKEFCSENGLGWVSDRGAGRLLRSPTVFEDLVKTMCTTNCSWGLTKNMVTNLVEFLGEGPDGSKAFPTPEAMAAQDEKFYRNEIKAGYRSPFFLELAGSVASKTLEPEKWLTSELPTSELKKEIKSVKGIGDYAAEHMLKMLGRYDGLALDSWLRGQFYKKHNRGRPCADKKIEKRYSKFGTWKGLALWCDMTEYWHNGENRS
jgi:3-methyladenine DNA glycosylase/8-oxoguanine DNA glycosylase